MTTAQKTDIEQIVVVPLKDIIVDHKWNARSGNWAADGGNEEEHYLIDLKNSIKTKGQDDPVILREIGGKLYLTAGFRRFTAISQLANEAKIENAGIKAIIRPLSDLEARGLNVRENTGRSDLKAADLAWGIHQLSAEHAKVHGKSPTAVELAKEIGKSQPYISKLLRIVTNTKPGIFKGWREATVSYPIESMVCIAGLPKTEQDAAWSALVNPPRDNDGDSDRGPNSWVKTQKNKASVIGELFGRLERMGLINTSGLDFETHIRDIIKIKNTATSRQLSSIAKAAEKAYDKALNAKDEVLEVEEEED